jgi:hypothetical protein
MSEPSENPRLEQFRAEIAALRLKEPDPVRDAQRLRIGAALIVVGIAMGAVAFVVSQSASDALQQRDAMIVAITGVAVTIAGGVVYLRYSLTQFLRLWLARFLFETTGRAQANATPPPFSVPPGTSEVPGGTENGTATVSRGDPARPR